MLGASFLSLLSPAIALIRPQATSTHWLLAAVCFVSGAIVMEIIHAFTPHEHEFRGLDGASASHVKWRRAVLITCAMALHNLPEGLALGIGSLQQDPKLVSGLLTELPARISPKAR